MSAQSMSGWENTPPREMINIESVVEHIMIGEYPLHPADIVCTCIAGLLFVCLLLTGKITLILFIGGLAGIIYKFLQYRINSRNMLAEEGADPLTSTTNTIHNYINHSDLRKRVNSGIDKFKTKTGEVVTKIENEAKDEAEAENKKK